MQKLRYFLFFISTAFSLTTSAQFTISGTVLDSSSREPLFNASVFCQNTTSGTVTNKDGAFSLTLKSGGYDLIFSFTGYGTQTIRVTEKGTLVILLIK